MQTRSFVFLSLVFLTLGFAVEGFAQVSAESAVKGNLSAVVLDPSGAVVPGAMVTLNGPTGKRTGTTDGQGNAVFLVLLPGNYSVTVEKTGFKKAALTNVEVQTNRTTGVRIKLETGTVTEVVEVTAGAVTVDTASSRVDTNLSTSFYERVPVARNVSGLFYIAPGVASGGGTGVMNPSISGGSGLENQYVADGVNITDTAFGGLGVFSRNYGSVGTGINLSFVKEVEIKTGGYEPQYGKTTGGVVQIVTKSGSNEFHGAITGFIQPKGLEGSYVNPDQFGLVNQLGDLRHTANYDLTGELGGYIPGFRDRLFFFGSMNPTVGDRFVRAPGVDGLSLLGDIKDRVVTYNYAAKLTAKLSDNHQLEGSVYGDPAHTNNAAWRRTTMDNSTAFSKQEYGSRNTVVRYNGSLSPTWLVNASVTWAHNHFDESGFPNFQRIINQTQTAGLPGQRGEFTNVGLGFVENTVDDNYGFNVDTTKIFHGGGEHTLSIGYRYERPFYDGFRDRSGPAVNLPLTNADGTTDGLDTSFLGAAANPSLALANYEWRLVEAPSTCTLCPLLNVPGVGMTPVVLRVFRSEFGLNPATSSKTFLTSGKYHAAYINDAWSPNKYVTLNLGLRWEIQRLTGQDLAYTFTDNWSPRIGIIVDPFGDRKNKIFANFGRYTYAIPLDLAERSLTNEFDMFSLRVAPAYTVNGAGQRIATLDQFGSVTPVVDAAHVLNGATGGVTNTAFVSFESSEPIHTGTRMSYLDEFVVGAEHEFPQGIVASVKYLNRNLKRIVEDTGGISPEAALAGVPQQFAITNVTKATDIFTNPIETVYNSDPANDTPKNPAAALAAGCPLDTTGLVTTPGKPIFVDPVQNSFGETVPPGAACFAALGVNGQLAGSLAPDGVPDGFVNPQRIYWAVEFEVNKSFSKNWLLRTNWRIAKLVGNFEGAFRNDNGQSDPSISSLFDFTPGQFNLLGDQFRPGVLNTDRRHIVNAFFSYYLDHSALKGLTIGSGVQFQTGIPINDLKAHPVYENAGEVPVNGRGSLGRTPLIGTVDLHLDYGHPLTEKTSLHFGADLFNIANSKRQLFINQDEDLAFGTPNVDFQKPTTIGNGNVDARSLGTGFQSPFNARLMVKFVF